MSKRVLFHYYHAGSLGHGHRIMALAAAVKARAPRSDVVVAAGGAPTRGVEPPDGVEWLQLPALTSSAEPTFTLRPANLSLPLDEVLRLRRELLMALGRRLRPHALVMDLFPFGRRFLAGELRPLCRLVRRQRPGARVFCSMRDLLGQGPAVYDAATARQAGRDLMNLVDTVLVHGDPELLTVDEELGLSPGARERLAYTGYVTGVGRDGLRRRDRVRASLDLGKEPLIIVSAGGGADGAPLLRVAARAGALLRKEGLPCRILMRGGPFLPEADHAWLAARAAAGSWLQVERHTPDLAQLLNAADLSVSMGGYNTCAELLLTGTPGVIVPRTSWEQEQLMRATALAARVRSLSVLEPNQLTPAALAAAMRSRLENARRRRRPRVMVDGAALAARLILGEPA